MTRTQSAACLLCHHGTGLDNEPVSKLRSAVVVPTRDGVYEVPAGDADAAGISPAGQAGEEQDETAEVSAHSICQSVSHDRGEDSGTGVATLAFVRVPAWRYRLRRR